MLPPRVASGPPGHCRLAVVAGIAADVVGGTSGEADAGGRANVLPEKVW